MKEMIANVINLFFTMIFGIADGIRKDALVTFGDEYGDIWKLVVNIANDVIEPIAAIMVLTFFILAMMDKVTTENFTLEHVLKEFMKLGIGLYLVTNSIELVTMFIELGNGVITSIRFDGINESVGWTEIMGEDIINANGLLSGVFALLIQAVLLLVVGLVQLIAFLLMKVVVLARTLDIAVRTAMSPIALADAFSGNFLNSNAMNFIRSFLAVCLQGAFIYVIAYFTPALMAAKISSSTDVWVFAGAMCQSIAVSLASLLLMFKSGSIAKEVLGAR